MALTAEEFHLDLERATRRAARRQTLTALVQTLALVGLVVWALYTTQRVAHDLEAARNVQRVTAEQNRLQTQILCQLAAQQEAAPDGCAPYLNP